MNKEVEIKDLGLIEYKKAWDYQEELLSKIVEVKIKNRNEGSNNSTKNYLISMGISPDRVSTVTFGKERPDVEGSYEDAWQLNRRSVTTLDVDRN